MGAGEHFLSYLLVFFFYDVTHVGLGAINANNKGGDQSASSRNLISPFMVHPLESIACEVQYYS